MSGIIKGFCDKINKKRECTKCFIIKNFSEFSHQNNSIGIRSNCKSCMSKAACSYSKKRKKKDPEYYSRVLNRTREYHIKNKSELAEYRLQHSYGLSPIEYQNMLLKQDNKCKICKKDFIKKPNVDHCHKTDQVRGLLCSKCNFCLGLAEDNVIILQNAIDYLKENKNG